MPHYDNCMLDTLQTHAVSVSDMGAAGLNVLTRESVISFFIKGPGFITAFKFNDRYAPCVVLK